MSSVFCKKSDPNNNKEQEAQTMEFCKPKTQDPTKLCEIQI